MLKDKKGKVCIAKNAFILSLGTVLVNYVCYFLFDIGSFDPIAASALLASTGAVYFGRSYSKDV